MGNLLIYSAADNFYIWPRALRLARLARDAGLKTPVPAAQKQPARDRIKSES